jgi:hypothetical protein
MLRVLRAVVRIVDTDIDTLLALTRASLAQAAAGGLDRVLLLAWQSRPRLGGRRMTRVPAAGG